jgi:hypothetical protein
VIAVSIQKGWLILSALRSDSSEWPRRIGVRYVDNGVLAGTVDGPVDDDADGRLKGFM